jgi:hypothetical protein
MGRLKIFDGPLAWKGDKNHETKWSDLITFRLKMQQSILE